MSRSHSREFLLDVSRLLWRVWRGKLPTGIDRVCLEYLDHFGRRSQAVVQFKGSTYVLSAKDSDRLFRILRNSGAAARISLLLRAPGAWLRSRRSPPRRHMLYLNVGHTGLSDPALPAWIAANQVRAVYLIHDLIPLTHPQFCHAGEAEKHALRMEHALSSAAAIIGNSQATIDDLAAFAASRGMPKPPSSAVWISGHRMAPPPNPRTSGRPHFSVVGTIEGRKNHLLLLRIWKRLAAEMGQQAPTLVIVGQRGWEADEVFKLLDGSTELRAHVHELSDCEDSELCEVIAGARALLMPSFAEGFGLPVIEALQVGTPVIASDLPVYREIVGDIPTYVAPTDEAAWESTIRDFLNDCPERERQKRAAKGYVAPSWTAHFAKVEQLLGNL